MLKMNISDEQWKEVKIWLKKFDLQKLSKNIWRDFSDGVLVANILKKLYPKLVEIHNYPGRSSTTLKIDNWQTLNRKVLKKLDLQLSNDMIWSLAKSSPGAIEKLLYHIMIRSQQDLNRSETNSDDSKLIEDADILTIVVTKQIGDAIIQVPQKMILYSLYENVINESLEQSKTITILQQKITHLENLLKLKTQRIEDLCSTLSSQTSLKQPFIDELSCSNTSSISSSQSY